MNIWREPFSNNRVRITVLLQLGLVWLVFREMALWSSVSREVWLRFIASCTASIAIVVIIPTFRKAPFRNRMALGLLMIFPMVVLVLVFDQHFRISECVMDWLVKRETR